MTALFAELEPATEWRSTRLLHGLYSVLAREFMIDLPVCPELQSDDNDSASEQSLQAARAWFLEADSRVAVHQLRQFFQTNSLANEASLLAALQHHLRKPEHNEADRDKVDFLLVQYFSVCAASPLADVDASLEYVARTLEPAIGKAELVVPEQLRPLEELIQTAESCGSLQELFSSGLLEKGRKTKHSAGSDYFTPAGLAASARFSFLIRRVFFRLMHQDLNAILDGLRDLEHRGVNTLDGRRADFSADEPVVRLRMICQSWKLLFQAEYAFGQPLRLLVELRSVVEAAVERARENAAAPDAPRALAAAASGEGTTNDAPAGSEARPNEEEL